MDIELSIFVVLSEFLDLFLSYDAQIYTNIDNNKNIMTFWYFAILFTIIYTMQHCL